jgi:hypothetical protein
MREEEVPSLKTKGAHEEEVKRDHSCDSPSTFRVASSFARPAHRFLTRLRGQFAAWLLFRRLACAHF